MVSNMKDDNNYGISKNIIKLCINHEKVGQTEHDEYGLARFLWVEKSLTLK